MSKGNIIFFSIAGLLLLFMGIMLFQEITYPKSTLQEMSPVAIGHFIIHRDCYNSPSYSIDANPISNHVAIRMDNRSESVCLWDLKENSEYRIYVRKGIRDYYFVECMN